MEIKAIETIYNGRRYRSRLEARWAVFFDSLGIRFEYEPEGFVLSNGMAYLPDFFLPDIGDGIFAEVKGSMSDMDLEKISTLAEDAERTVAVLGDIPEHGESADISVYYDFGAMDMGHEFCVCPKCGKIGLQFEARAARNCLCTDDDREYVGVQAEVAAAYDKARMARFEHGETP
jgi:hypothetical protein